MAVRFSLKSLQCWITVAAAIFAPLFFGSVDLFWVVCLTMLLSAAVICGAFIPLNSSQAKLLVSFLAVCLVYGAIALIQVAPDWLSQWNDPIWQRLASVFPGEAGRISSRAEIPPLALGHFLLFATAFVSGFYVGTSQTQTKRLVLVITIAIVAYAAYGLYASIFRPNSLLWIERPAYWGSLTATFVNRNTAASLIGMGLILTVAYLSAHVATFQFSSSWKLFLLLRSSERWLFELGVKLFGVVICLTALRQTGSRAGILFATVGMLVTLSIVLAGRIPLGRWAIIGGTATLLVVGVAVSLSIGRLGSEGLFDDARWAVYQAAFASVAERPWLGSGLGSFPDVFPALRSSEMPITGIWEMAHSTTLEIAIEMGVPIAIVIAGCALISVLILLQASRRAPVREFNFLAAATGIAVFTFLHAIVDFSLQVPGFSTVFAVLLGCALARALAPERKRSRSADRAALV